MYLSQSISNLTASSCCCLSIPISSQCVYIVPSLLLPIILIWSNINFWEISLITVPLSCSCSPRSTNSFPIYRILFRNLSVNERIDIKYRFQIGIIQSIEINLIFFLNTRRSDLRISSSSLIIFLFDILIHPGVIWLSLSLKANFTGRFLSLNWLITLGNYSFSSFIRSLNHNFSVVSIRRFNK